MLDLPDMQSTLLVQALRLGVVLLLYALLLRLLWTLRRELASGSASAVPGTNADEAYVDADDLAPVLVVVDVEANGSAAALDLVGRRFTLGATNVIGRNPTSSIVIAEPHVSRRHARIDFRDGEWWLNDLGSTNGTYLDERQVEEPASILLGDVIRVGGVALAVREEPV